MDMLIGVVFALLCLGHCIDPTTPDPDANPTSDIPFDMTEFEVPEMLIAAEKGAKSRNALDFAKLESAEVDLPTPPPFHRGHVTPDWIIMVSFVLALAALVSIFIAIGTRDKWNAPNPENKTIKAIPKGAQRRALEKRAPKKEPFVRRDPLKNGKPEEYTIIPLDEMPHSSSK